MSDWTDDLFELSKDDQAVIVGSDVRRLVGEIRSLRETLDAGKREPTMATLLDAFDAEIEQRAQELRRPHGGQTVTPGGDFVNVTPSTLGRLRWWSRAFREAAGLPDARRALSPSPKGTPTTESEDPRG